jgi:hypothetical protein
MPKNCWKRRQFTIAVIIEFLTQCTVLSAIDFAFHVC